MIATKQTIIKGTFICCILALLGGLALLNPSCVKKAQNQNTPKQAVDNNNNPSSPVASGDVCRKPGGGNCKGNEKCEEWCDDLFRGGKDEDKCLEKYSVDEIEGIYVAFNDGRRGDEGLLEDPEIDYDDDDDDITSICHEDVKNLLTIDERHWNGLINGYDSSNAEDVLFWLTDNDLIFERGIRETIGNDDSQDLIESLLYKFKPKDADRDHSGIPAALREEMGDEPDPEDTFISLTNSNKLKELAHDILLKNCVSDTPKGETIYDTGDNKPIKGANADQKKVACALGEVYCIKDGDDYIFDGSFADILGAVDDSLEDFIKKDDSPGLNFRSSANKNKEEDELTDVCKDFCDKWPTTGGNAITDNADRPKACPQSS